MASNPLCSPTPSSPSSPVASFTAFLTGSDEWHGDASPSSSSNLLKGMWSEEEHGRFIDALKRYPHGPWKAITACVGTRSIRQVQTHAQKYMEKVQRRQRGLKTAQPRLVRRDHKIDDEVEPWWKRENGMVASSPTRTKSTTRRRRHKRQDSEDTTASSSSSDFKLELSDDDEGPIVFEPLPLQDELALARALPSLEECLAVVNECLVDPLASLQLEQSMIV